MNLDRTSSFIRVMRQVQVCHLKHLLSRLYGLKNGFTLMRSSSYQCRKIIQEKIICVLTHCTEFPEKNAKRPPGKIGPKSWIDFISNILIKYNDVSIAISLRYVGKVNAKTPFSRSQILRIVHIMLIFHYNSWITPRHLTVVTSRTQYGRSQHFLKGRKW